MTNIISSTAVIRDRGQITIPDKFRERAGWASPKRVVVITLVKDKEIVIKPYEKEAKEVDWDRVWEAVAHARSLKGKRGNLSGFIVKDRERHNILNRKR